MPISTNDKLFIEQSLNLLRTAGLLNREYWHVNSQAILTHQHPKCVALALNYLNEAALLSGEQAQINFQMLLAHQDLGVITKVFASMQGAGLLNSAHGQANFQAIIAHQDLWDADKILGMINSAGLLSAANAQANFQAIVTLQNLWLINKVLEKINSAGLLSGAYGQANFQAIMTHRNLWEIDKLIERMDSRGLLSAAPGQANFQAIMVHQNLWALNVALERINNAGLLSDTYAQANFRSIVEHQDPWALAMAFNGVMRAGLLSDELAQANFQALLSHQNLSAVIQGLEILITSGPLRSGQVQAGFQAIAAANHNPKFIALVLASLNTAGLLEQALAHIQAITSHQDPNIVAWALITLNTAGFLNSEHAQANLHAMIHHQCPGTVVSALNSLNDQGLLSSEQAQANFQAVTSHQDPTLIARGLTILNTEGLLNEKYGQANRQALVNNPEVVGMLYILQRANLLNLLNDEQKQTYFDEVITHKRILNQINWNHIPLYLLTAVHFTALINLCVHHQGDIEAGGQAAQDYVDDLIRVPQEREENALNQAQSTHTASVHLATDLTAWLLQHRYAELSLTPRQVQEEFAQFTGLIKEFDHKAANQQQHAAAVRALERLDDAEVILQLEGPDGKQKERCLQLIESTNLKDLDLIKSLLPSLLADKDKPSSLSLKQFIVLLFYAAKDHPIDERENLETIYQAFVDALYEIQRGYNLEQLPLGARDSGDGEDLTICYGGTANKFCEFLSSFSPLIQFIYITEESINLKLKQILLHRVRTKLEVLGEQCKTDLDCKTQLTQYITSLMDEEAAGEFLTTCWHENEMAIKDSLFAEFIPYSLSYGDEKLLECLQQFKEHSLPYLGAINPDNPNYPSETKTWFAKLRQKHASLASKPLLATASFFSPSTLLEGNSSEELREQTLTEQQDFKTS